MFSLNSPRLLTGLGVAAFILALALDDSPSMAARSVPSDIDAAHPDWPCCRQYGGPPAVAELEVEETVGAELEVAVVEAALIPAAVNIISGEAAAEPEWPCCRQYDGPPAASQVTGSSEESTNLKDAVDFFGGEFPGVGRAHGGRHGH